MVSVLIQKYPEPRLDSPTETGGLGGRRPRTHKFFFFFLRIFLNYIFLESSETYAKKNASNFFCTDFDDYFFPYISALSKKYPKKIFVEKIYLIFFFWNFFFCEICFEFFLESSEMYADMTFIEIEANIFFLSKHLSKYRSQKLKIYAFHKLNSEL